MRTLVLLFMCVALVVVSSPAEALWYFLVVPAYASPLRVGPFVSAEGCEIGRQSLIGTWAVTITGACFDDGNWWVWPGTHAP